MANTENAEEQRDQGGRFVSGNSGGPGRPKGSRNKFAQQYIDDYYNVWQRKGIKALEDCADKQPAKFILVAAHLIPQHFKIEHEHKLTLLSEEELKAKLLEAQEELAKAGMTLDLAALEVPALPAPTTTSSGKNGK